MSRVPYKTSYPVTLPGHGSVVPPRADLEASKGDLPFFQVSKPGSACERRLPLRRWYVVQSIE
jgi:hypothetical protein